MAEPKLLTAFWCEFELIRISDGATQTTRWGDFSRIDGELFSGQSDIFPGLIDISGFTLEVGEPLPVRNGGTIVLDCTRGVFNKDGRPSDYLKTFFWINSRVVIKSWIGYPTDIISTSGDSRVEFVGIVKDVDFNPQTNQMRIGVEPVPITTKFEQCEISTENFPSTTQNFGKYLPLCFGNPIVPAYNIYSDTLSGAYGYAAYPTGYTNFNWVKLYTPNNRGQYVEITDDGSLNPKFGTTAGATTIRILRASYQDGATPTNSRSFRQKFTATKNYLCQAIDIPLINTTGASVTYDMIFDCLIYKRTKTENSDFNFELLTAGSYEFVSTTIANNGTTTITVKFDEPIPFEIGKNYFVEFAIAGTELQTADLLITMYTGTGTGSKIFRRLGNSDRFDRLNTDIQFNWEMRNYIFDNIAVNNGQTVVISPTVLGGSEQSIFQEFDIIVQAGGLRDDGSGTITGTASAAIDDPYEITRFLLRDQISFLDTSTFNAATILRTNYPRTVDGYSKGRQSNEQILSQILKETACKLVPRNDGLSTKYWALYPYGYQSSSVRYISELECKILGWKMFGRESVVNAVDLAYSESAIPQTTSALQAGQPQRFTKFKRYENGTAANVTTWTQESFSRFGTRPNNNSWTELSWVDDDTTANFYAQHLLQTYSRPKVVVSLELAFFESDFRTIQCMDIIEISHPDLPSEFGTTPDTLTPPPVYNGAVVETANFGFPLRQAQSYKLQVISREVIFNIRGNAPAALRLDCRLLWNPYEIY